MIKDDLYKLLTLLEIFRDTYSADVTYPINLVNDVLDDVEECEKECEV